jgi:hypothetical protein
VAQRRRSARGGYGPTGSGEQREGEEATVDAAPRKKDSKAPHRRLCGGVPGVVMLDGEQRRLWLDSALVCGDLRGRDDELVGWVDGQCAQVEEGGGGLGGAAGLDPATRRGGRGKSAAARLPGGGGRGALARTEQQQHGGAAQLLPVTERGTSGATSAR